MYAPVYFDTPNSSGNASSGSSESSEKSFFDRNLSSIVNGKEGKMFCGGLNATTTVDGLRFYFSKFGEIEDCVIMRDAKSKLSRGFGFVTFYNPADIDKVLEVKEHFLDGKKIDPQRAIKSISPARSVHNIYKKLFLGGVSQSTRVEDLKKYFSEKFGFVEDVVLKVDYPKLTHRGFGFITFLDESVADKVCEIRYHKINGKTVETKPAQKKEFVNLNPTAAETPSQSYVQHCWPGTFAPHNSNDVATSSFMMPWSMDCVPVFAQSPPQFFDDSETSFRKRIAAKYMSRISPFAC